MRDLGEGTSMSGKTDRSLITSELIEERAAELAWINGRTKNQITESDRILAKKELFADEAANDPADDAEIVAGGMGYPPTSTGHQTPKYLPDDDEIEEKTIQHGVDEAEHETMVQASKSKTRNSG